MKKIICTVLALCMLSAMSYPVFATETVTAKGVYVTGVTLPEAGAEIPGAKFSVTCRVPAKVETRTEGTEPGTENVKTEEKELSVTANATWSEVETPDTAATGTFSPGKMYRLTVEAMISGANPIFNSETEYLINGVSAKQKSASGNTVILYADFTASLGDFTPAVTLKATGGKLKTYDGKATTLEAVYTAVDSVEYRYQWYRNGEAVKDKTEKTISLKTVADSGKYYCQVTATAPAFPASGEKIAKSEEVEINIATCLVTIDIQNAEKNLFDPDPEFTYEILGNPPDKMTGKLTRQPGEDLGTYAIEIGTLAFPADVAKNYEVLVTSGTLTILSTGVLPFHPVSNLNDQTTISGKNDAKIRVFASKGAFPDSAVMTIGITEDAVLQSLKKEYTSKIMKSFSLSLKDSAGKTLTLPKHATIRVQIPLTEEEEAFRPETLRCSFYNNGTRNLKIEVTEENGVKYATVEITSMGSIALYEGLKTLNKPVQESEAHVEEEEKEKEGSLWMWILIILISLCAIGAMIFTAVQSKRSAAPTRTYVPSKNKPVSAERQQEIDRARKIADEINAMAPVPELDQNNPHNSGMVTRPIPTAAPTQKLNVDLRTGTPMDPNAKKPADQSGAAPRKISFEDLE